MEFPPLAPEVAGGVGGVTDEVGGIDTPADEATAWEDGMTTAFIPKGAAPGCSGNISTLIDYFVP